jgi:DNA mismatch endonuclease (patch repair protein)
MRKRITKQQRSYIMSRISGSKTKPELKLKPLMRTLGFAYQPKGIYGRPDFANRKQKIAIFVDGCFWHKCPNHYSRPKSNLSYWNPKIKRNVERDIGVNSRLRKEGWKVIRVWEHSIQS